MFCPTCNLTLKNKACYDKHLKTSRHIQRCSTDVTTFKCVCGKGYLYNQSLYVHRKTCEIHRSNKENNTRANKEVTAYKDEYQETISTLEKRCKQLEARLEENKNIITIRHQGRRKLSENTWEEVATRQENKCNQCQVNLTKYYQIDHKTALQFGGTDEFDNLQALCCECHAEKSVLENQHRKEIQEAIQTILQRHAVKKWIMKDLFTRFARSYASL